MSAEEKRYRITAEYKSVHQLIIEATSPEEAEYFAKDIDLDKWQFIDGDYEIVDVSKDFFLKRVKNE
jgi:hypothetical protein